MAALYKTAIPVPEVAKMSTITAQQIDTFKLTNIIPNGNQNYIPWSKSVSITLGGKGKLRHVSGTKPKPQ
jgi:gag-polypeptide of LTR copia-type